MNICDELVKKGWEEVDNIENYRYFYKMFASNKIIIYAHSWSLPGNEQLVLHISSELADGTRINIENSFLPNDIFKIETLIPRLIATLGFIVNFNSKIKEGKPDDTIACIDDIEEEREREI